MNLHTKRFLSSVDKRPTIILSNSYCTISNFSEEATKIVTEALSYVDESVEQKKIRLYKTLKYASELRLNKLFWGTKRAISELPDPNVCLLKNSRFPAGLLQMVQKLLHEYGYTHVVKDHRVKPTPYNTFRWNNRPEQARYYQEDMDEISLKVERGVFVSAVGTGKTRVAAQVIKNHEVNTLYVVPSSALLKQTADKLTTYFGKKNVKMVNSSMVKANKKLPPIRVMTVQSLVALRKKGNLHKVVSDVDMLIVDEVHHCGADTYQDLIGEMDHIYYRYGFTGTFERNDHKTLELHGFLSNVLYTYTAAQAIKDGFLTPTEYITLEIRGIGRRNYQSEYNMNYCDNIDLLNRIKQLIDIIPKDEQILILTERKDKLAGILHTYLLEQALDNSYMSGDNSKEEINQMIKNYNEKKVRILIGTSVIGEGVDIHSAQHLVIATGGKSRIKFVQAVGRCVRLHPGKLRSYVYDFNFVGTKYLTKHYYTRKSTFEQNFSEAA